MSKSIHTDHLIVLAKLIGEVDWAPINNDLCKFYSIFSKKNKSYLI